MAGFNESAVVQVIAVPAVCTLIAFLGYFPQILFRNETLQPGPPSTSETYIFNTLLGLLWYTYYKAVTTDPGRYVFDEKIIEVEGRWCNKCDAPKPPRAHHCRHCKRCVPKMDHHCPWTKNCVSMTTFPHFYRFLCYANFALWYLGYLVFQRFYALWEERHMPAYLGPSIPVLASLAISGLVCFFTSLLLGIMLVTTTKNWIFNQTTIESWEADRHEAIAERGGKDWWDVTGPDGKKFRFEKIEFPYDIGFFENMSQAMGTSFFPMWLFPFAGNPKIGTSKSGKRTGWEWEENGFNRTEGMWPPPDPEKIRRAARTWPAGRRDFDAELRALDADDEQFKEAFRKRQAADIERRKNMMVAELEEDDEYGMPSDVDENGDWANDDGEKLVDFGVDVDDDMPGDDRVEGITTAHDEDVPLAELIRRRKAAAKP